MDEDTFVPQRPSEFDNNEAWAHALLDQKWELEDRVEAAEPHLKAIEREVLAWRSDRGEGQVTDDAIDTAVERICDEVTMWPEPRDNVSEVRVAADNQIRRLLEEAGIPIGDRAA